MPNDSINPDNDPSSTPFPCTIGNATSIVSTILFNSPLFACKMNLSSFFVYACALACAPETQVTVRLLISSPATSFTSGASL